MIGSVSPSPPPAELLTAMITPAVLISASGTLILSTSTRLARVVDRVRELSRLSEALFTAADAPFAELRWKGIDEQLDTQTRRGALLQRALTCFYVALGIFVAAAIALAVVSYAPPAAWIPSALGIVGMLTLFYGCVMLLRETRLALRAVDSEMAFVLELSARHRREAPPR
jgi:uncharacterized membrane protein YidH (DUF202 family)